MSAVLERLTDHEADRETRAPVRINLRSLAKQSPAPRPMWSFPELSTDSRDRCLRTPVVAAAQHLLRAYYPSLTVDGLFGTESCAATMAFQERTHREPTGVLAEADWHVLVEQSAVTIGSKGTAVQAVQLLLNHHLRSKNRSVPPLLVDGVFGTATLMRVRDAQGRVGLKVDGIVGARTYAPLFQDEG